MSAFGYLLDRSVGLPSRAYRDSFYTRQTATLLQHAPSTSNFIFRQGMRVWSFSLDPAEQRFLLVARWTNM
ncbi:hypothetical protein PInf_009224 [Phytophthora infestans]|nr:hypothetical protein PInf_009224 [Phytophthora infestans]